MVIVRSVSTFAFLLSLQANGVGIGGYAATFVGLQKNSTGNWVWIDGQDCDFNLISDERCYGNCAFDGDGPYGNINRNFPVLDDMAEYHSDGSVFCEAKCKI
jgi:hypothetical protein